MWDVKQNPFFLYVLCVCVCALKGGVGGGCVLCGLSVIPILFLILILLFLLLFSLFPFLALLLLTARGVDVSSTVCGGIWFHWGGKGGGAWWVGIYVWDGMGWDGGVGCCVD